MTQGRLEQCPNAPQQPKDRSLDAAAPNAPTSSIAPSTTSRGAASLHLVESILGRSAAQREVEQPLRESRVLGPTMYKEQQRHEIASVAEGTHRSTQQAHCLPNTRREASKGPAQIIVPVLMVCLEKGFHLGAQVRGQEQSSKLSSN